jgi:glutamate/tyrosine decarboxylase-like PLP-dependent enzyme
MDELLTDACARAGRYLSSIQARRVAPSPESVARLAKFYEPVPDRPCDPLQVLSLLDEVGSGATVASTGGRYFGFVTGGTLPVALAANWFAGAWDQNAALGVMSPVAAALEEVVLRWLRDLLGLPLSCGAGFVTGATMANLSCLAAARHALLDRAGWNVEDNGLFGAPPLTVIVGDEVHVSLLKALSLLGLGRSRVVRIPADTQGRMRPEALPPLNDRTIVCVQAGNVNTGAFDPVEEICSRARQSNAWVHVDGAFGLWAAAAPERAHLTAGLGEADSWATDCHKWLNVPYDSGLVFVAHPAAHRAAMSLTAAYLVRSANEPREPMDWTPESSRRARGFSVYAAVRSLGRAGIEDLVDRCCRLARRFADRLRREPGIEILNEVVLNQILVRVVPRSGNADAATRAALARVQEARVCWLGGTRWHDMDAMRISVSNWSTTEEDIDRSADSIIAAVRA